jgi:drug/metabolite transporter (DMT)-like permease
VRRGRGKRPRGGGDGGDLEGAHGEILPVLSGTGATGLAAALGAAACYDGGYALQALEARLAPPAHLLHASLLVGLARRPRWVAGIVLALVGWALQVLALRLAPVTLVQPALACGLVLLLVLGERVLHEHVGAREWLAGLVILVGVAVIALVTPGRSGRSDKLGLTLALVALGIVTVVPYLLRSRVRLPGGVLVASAGAADVWAVLAARELGDELASGQPVLALAWAVGAGLAVLAGLTSEMSALQRVPATRVGPAVLVLQIVGPVALAPAVLGEGWGGTPLGGLVLAGAVGAVLAAAAWLLTSSTVARSSRGEEAVAEDAGGGGPGGP